MVFIFGISFERKNLNMRWEIIMKEIFWMDEDMVKEYFIIPVERNTSVIGKRIKNMEEEKWYFEMARV